MSEFVGSFGPLETGLAAVSLLGFAFYLLLLERPASLLRTVAKTLAIAALAALTIGVFPLAEQSSAVESSSVHLDGER